MSTLFSSGAKALPRRPLLTRSILIFGYLLFLAAAPASGRQVSWDLFDRGEPCALPDRPGELLACGRFGALFLEHGSDARPPVSALPGSCPHVGGGVEVPSRYSARRGPESGPDPREDQAPCSEGSCLTPLAGLTAGEPWVAVIDWDDWHGWAMSWTIRQTMAPQALPIVLFPLGEERLEPADDDSEETDDLSLLTQLCALTEAVDSGFVARPSVINMSFGRAAGPGTAPSGLAQVVNDVLDYLGQASATGGPAALVAAAGNHRQLLFPAAHPGVLAAGAADLVALKNQGEYRPSWESPPVEDPMALFPAGGLCLQYGDSQGKPAARLMAPGSSFAAAVFSGMLAEQLQLDAALIEQLPGVAWTPSLLQPSVPPEILLERLQGQALADCAPALAPDPSLTFRFSAEEPIAASDLPNKSLVDVAQKRLRPTPEPDPCVPCMSSDLNPGGGGLDQNPDSRMLKSPFAAQRGASRNRPGRDLVIDLSGATVSLEDLEYDLKALYLRTGDWLYPLTPAGGHLSEVARGAPRALVIEEMGFLVESGEQPSLVYVLGNRESDPGEESGEGAAVYWTAAPILLQPGPQ
ncbi:MAG: S8/S53 family peptidase [Acidobacteriota bacterium]